ncbi:hypothetical protein BDK51DRAFT_29106 [Blyttiomyces helicus]|uniref:Uncharacterized protein n=1 Tax=Blyttiomyces helicus TaxID=388810 RepID=A0A4P9WN66_9FUNG|nr:hypothetical protein BDK51DRAFT_29106 [Blyttiomyces helicus]|eukprot:RKO93695.1 hypothetical protein BDK51DRAFT_29106 [Blyttiomyces helicus]
MSWDTREGRSASIWSRFSFVGRLSVVGRLGTCSKSSLTVVLSTRLRKTAKVAGEADGMTWFAYIHAFPEKGMASATPTVFLKDMTWELENFSVVVERFKTGEEDLEEDDKMRIVC